MLKIMKMPCPRLVLPKLKETQGNENFDGSKVDLASCVGVVLLKKNLTTLSALKNSLSFSEILKTCCGLFHLLCTSAKVKIDKPVEN